MPFGEDTNLSADVFVRDLLNGTTTLVSVDSAGVLASYGGAEPSLSADGRSVAFRSFAANLVPGDTNAKTDIFVHDLRSGATRRVSVDSSGAQVSSNTYDPLISADGQHVVFWSNGAFVPGDTNGIKDVFVRTTYPRLRQR